MQAKKKAATWALGLALMATLSGCAGMPNLATLPGQKPAAGSGALANGQVNQPLEPLNGLQFRPITDGAMLQNGGLQSALGGQNNAQRGGGGTMASADAVAPAAAPMPTGASAGMATSEAAIAPPGGKMMGGNGGAASGNVYGYYGYGYFFGAENDQMALVSLQQAEAAGVNGGFKEVVAQVAAPAVKEWAQDARLVQTQALVDQEGKLFPAPEGSEVASNPLDGFYGDRSGWRLVYRSSARGEVLIFTVTSAKTLVIRLRWAPLNLDPARVAVDSGAAIQSVAQAVASRSAQSEEEKTGLDYFLGVKYQQPDIGYRDENNRTEVVFAVSPKTRWNVSLDMIMGKLVWNLNGYANDEAANPDGPIAMPMPAIVSARPEAAPGVAVGEPNPNEPVSYCSPANPVERMGWYNQSIQAMVDAESGAVIRFSRPMKHFYKDMSPVPCSEPGSVPFPGSERPVPEPAKQI